MTSSEILCVGEVLWDSLPAGLFLGGAPFNVACHLRAAGLPASMVSRVGDDMLGQEVLRRLTRFGVGSDLVQTDPALPTGFVRVNMKEADDPEYEIVAPAAWDAIEATPELLERAGAARAIVFGSLAQRHEVTRATIERLWETDALMVFDANLRPPHEDRDIIRRSLEAADIVKMNRRELEQLAGWFGLGSGLREGAVALAERFRCHTVCITRGADGAALWREGRWTEQPGFEVEVRDTVGAGDAFLAVLLAGLLAGTDDATVLRHAALMGAWVVTQVGAVPPDQPAVANAAAPAAPAPARSRPSPAPRNRRPER